MQTALARFRATKGWSLETLGDCFDVDKSTVLRWERGQVPIPVKHLSKAVAVTGLSREELRPDIFEEQRQ